MTGNPLVQHFRRHWRWVASEVVCQALHGVHAGVLHGPLSDLAQGAERNATFTRHLALRESLGPQMLHHEVVDFGRGLHGLKAYSHLWLKAIAAHGFS